MDVDTIINLFRNLDDYLEQLRHLSAYGREDLARAPVLLGAAKYYLQVAIACCIDVANHLIASHNWRPPESYADSFTVLAEKGVLPAEFLPAAHRMARLRNRLVDLYWEVDPAQICEILQHDVAARCGLLPIPSRTQQICRGMGQ